MRKKEWKLIITFHTTAEAMRMEKYCKQHRIEGRLIPVPRAISSGCGLCWCTELSLEERIKASITEAKLSIQDIHHCMV